MFGMQNKISKPQMKKLMVNIIAKKVSNEINRRSNHADQKGNDFFYIINYPKAHS